jgi:hypothetical protein
MSLTGSRFSSESAQGPSIMEFDDEVEQSFGRPCRETNGKSERPNELTLSSSHEGHLSTAWWSSSDLLVHHCRRQPGDILCLRQGKCRTIAARWLACGCWTGTYYISGNDAYSTRFLRSHTLFGTPAGDRSPSAFSSSRRRLSTPRGWRAADLAVWPTMGVLHQTSIESF